MCRRFLYSLVAFLLPLLLVSQSYTKADIKKWEKQSENVTIIRDQYGIPHVYGKTDADAVFGLMYAQCEDDFKRVELNYIEKLGRKSEIFGEKELYNDLLIKMIIDTTDAKKDYEKAPKWLKKLCNSFADGINYYLYSNPEVKPALLQKFEPWYPFLWTDGSIGAINTAELSARDLRNMYENSENLSYLDKINDDPFEEKLVGSNGFAFSPKLTTSGNAMLYINPHVTFYFRPEVHMVSDEGLNAYGAVTWGQFFIYQGFNEKCGWIHTSSAVDAADTYMENMRKKGEGFEYEYDGQWKKASSRKITIDVTTNNQKETKAFDVIYTHHGPVMAKKDGKWISMKSDNRLYEGILQSWLRTKSKGLEDFNKTMDLKGNISNNTVYADAQGNIAYWHGNRIPVKDTKYDWSKPVDGSISATEWKGYHPVSETVHSINPKIGWLQNCNATPFTVAGGDSPRKEDYPSYMAPDGENFRGINAVDVLSKKTKYDLQEVINAGYDTKLTAFELLIPALVKAFDEKIAYEDTLFAHLAGPIAVLRGWNFRSSTSSIATTLAIQWAQKVWPEVLRTNIPNQNAADQVDKTKYFVQNGNAHLMIQSLSKTIEELKMDFGKWQIPWGDINRFQRISTDIDSKFDDALPSYPVGFVSSAFGMLPSYNSRTFPGTKKRYGVSGNSFICAVEFGPRIKAKSLLAGGNSGVETSPHFFDQGKMYAEGQFKDVLFYKEDVLKNAKVEYKPGKK
jgi:acyl-homoserine lactone acylase PvdQ